MILSFRALLSATSAPINAASILPDLLERFGDITDVLAEIAPRRILVAAGVGTALPSSRQVQLATRSVQRRFEFADDWIGD